MIPRIPTLTTLLAAALVAALTLSAPVLAQQTTGSIQGTVRTPTGEPAANQRVVITDTRTGSVSRTTTSGNGSFSVRGLPVGGPYTVLVDSDEYRDTSVTDVFTSLSSAATFDITLEGTGPMEEVVVTSSAAVATIDVAIGPSSTFSFEEINDLPSITRQIRDIIRVDPRVNIERSNGGNGFGINCLGGSGRANSFTVDGVRSADGFGLNASGNSARNTFPVPFDSVNAASVEFAPVDVQYGQFTGCNINVVTKSGTNEFQGSGFYLYNDDDLTGDSIRGDVVITEPFEEKDYGFELGGPIIKDQLFFYVSWEKTDEGDVQNSGPIGGGFANEEFITVDDVNRIAGILRDRYGRDPGEIVRNLPQGSERKFARIDWNITDRHRLEATYVDLEEDNLEPDDFGFNGLALSDNFELEGTESEAFSFRLFSNWTDRFSTEVRYSQIDVKDIQGPLGGGEAQDDNPKPRIIVQDETGSDIFVSGPGLFRSANDLQYQIDQAKLAGFYDFDRHQVLLGYELDSLDVFNLFVTDGTGTIEFASIDDLEAGQASFITGGGSFTGNINDAAAAFERDINTVYLQDKWQVTDDLLITAGLRYDWYDSNDFPIENPVFVERYGFTNTTSFDGLDILLPRVGLTYDLPPLAFGDVQLRAGFGIFTGGDPTVHFANSFQNFGGAIGIGSSNRDPCTAEDLQVIQGGTFTGIPDCIVQQQIADATQNIGPAAALDPDFDLPSQQRWNIGASIFTTSDIGFFNDWEIQLDYIYSNHKDSLDWVDLTLTQRVDDNGNPVFLPDGRPRFFAIDPLLEGCDATFIGIREGFANVTAACNAGGDDQDILMTNGPSGSTDSISIQLARHFNLTSRTELDLRFGYAYTDAKVANPVNSSTATSSFEEVAVAVINRPEIGPAVWANKHNIVLNATLKHYFFEDNPTSIGIFFRRRSGRPFSYVYDNNTPTLVFGDSDNEERNLLYVPTGPDDPLVDFSVLEAQGTLNDFFAFLDETGLSKFAGQIAPKNGFTGPWNSDLDLRISQDIPLPGWDHKLRFFFDIENFLNLISDDQNVAKFPDGGDVQEGLPVLDAVLSEDGSQFVLSNFNPGGGFHTEPRLPEDLDVDDSVWRIQLGIRYEFY